MGELFESTCCLRFFGDDLHPEELTASLGVSPTKSARKGDARRTHAGTNVVAKSGKWLLEAPRMLPANLDAQIAGILGLASQDLSIWQSLTTRFDADVFCGLFMRDTNEGLGLSQKTLADLAARGLKLDFDVYNPIDQN